ncbi:unnamed protein product, partial [Vitis vinifera]
MGKDWHWGGRSTKRGGGEGGGRPEGGGGGATTSCGGDKNNSATPSGCMSAVLQFFDFHQFQFVLHQPQPPLKPHSFLPEDPTLLKGVEAPRNSLESEESSLSSMSKEEEENLNIPVGIQIKTSGDTRLKVGATNDLSSESSCSPATKTPNLVARLMGLDLLPDDSLSPSSSSHQATQLPLGNCHHRCFLDNDFMGTRSLPETPRISSARRSDVDHRLSLQINKENIGTSEELELSRSLSILNQGRDHEHAAPNKSKKNPKVCSKSGDEFSPSKQHSTPSCSPRLRFLETKTKPLSTSSTKDQKPHSPKPLSPLSSSSMDNHSQVKIPLKLKVQPLQNHHHNQQSPIKKCKKATGQHFGARLKKSPKTSETIRNKQEEPFVRPSTAKNPNHSDKKCKKTPLSTDLLNIAVPNLVPFKKEPSPPTTKIPQKQVYEEEARHMPAAREKESEEKAMTTTQAQGAAEFQYISRILKRTGLDRDTPVSSIQFFSPSLPLHPSIFHQLEKPHATTPHPANPLLIFHLVNEFLPEILKPHVKNCHEMRGWELYEKLYEKIGSIKCWNCEVLEDIDAMVDEDLPKWKLRRARGYAEEEEEEIVAEIERDILEKLVHETTVDYGVGVRTETALLHCEYVTEATKQCLTPSHGYSRTTPMR